MSPLSTIYNVKLKCDMNSGNFIVNNKNGKIPVTINLIISLRKLHHELNYFAEKYKIPF